MLAAQFQCEFCWFININKRPGSEFSLTDREQLKLIRQVNLDSFWSREPKTVSDMVKYCGLNSSFARTLPSGRLLWYGDIHVNFISISEKRKEF